MLFLPLKLQCLLTMASVRLSFSGINLRCPSTSPARSAYIKPTIVSAGVAQNLSYWDSIHSDIDFHLKKALPIREPISVFEPMHHLVFAPPKTTASALCVAACELVGGNREDAIVAASAIHLMHAAIYTHDHLMLTDSDQKTPHRFGPNIELLTGDGIFPFGFELLAASMDPAGDNSDKILRVIIEITRAAGLQGIVNGQDSDVEFDQSGGQTRRSLHGCGAACGAILGGGSDDEIERLRRYGVYAGKIQGLLSEIGRKERGKLELVEKWRALALKELEYLDSKRIEQISIIVRV
ncbi:heterodimeric geranylgeranyl pyrophosphate synthase small subunit, chloroplastic [Lactuca sativa]|nr:heterodimeric geranylgeranyl pyrophosphate synthase small subunit, chloroplastic [Lactuca sativa]